MSLRRSRTSSGVSAAVRRGFILVQDTLCDGVVPGEWSVDGGVILYDTRDAAELERAAWAELHDEALRDEFMAPVVANDGLWIEPAELHADGSLVLPRSGVRVYGPAASLAGQVTEMLCRERSG